MGLVLDWKNTLGYRFDPFEPSVLRPILVYGLDELKERFNLWLIKGGQLGTITGEKGSGKTMFLRWIETELAPKKSHQQYYLDAKANGSADDLRKALGARHGLFSKFLPNKTKDEQELLAKLAKQQSVILIDNAGGLHKDALQLLGHVLDKTPAHAVLADTADRLGKIELPAKDGLALRIGKYDHADLRSILSSRINAAGVAGTHPFDDAEIPKLLKMAEGNPAQLLRSARERAIELSLKNGKGQVAAPTPAAKKKLISIRITKAPAKDASDAQATTRPASSGEIIDAAALNEIIAETAQPAQHESAKPAPKRQSLTTDELKIFHELAKQEEKHAHKRPTKKAAVKKKR